jgi:hypothetical protein
VTEPSIHPDVEGQWAALHQACADRASRLRLARLRERLCHRRTGVLESAAAELDLAARLLRAGCGVQFLPESRARTADLECRLAGDRFYVEVTVMVGSSGRRQAARGHRPLHEEQDEGSNGRLLVDRIVGRIAGKAGQLSDYCAPVVLAISLPYRDEGVAEVDLRQLAGSVTVLLPLLRQISAVLLSLWHVAPSPARSALRLANVRMVERAAGQVGHPRARLLITNPAARYPLSRGQSDTLTGLL